MSKTGWQETLFLACFSQNRPKTGNTVQPSQVLETCEGFAFPGCFPENSRNAKCSVVALTLTQRGTTQPCRLQAKRTSFATIALNRRECQGDFLFHRDTSCQSHDATFLIGQQVNSVLELFFRKQLQNRKRNRLRGRNSVDSVAVAVVSSYVWRQHRTNRS